MFGSLKEKLKNWTSKIKEEVFGKGEEKAIKGDKTSKQKSAKTSSKESVKTPKSKKSSKSKKQKEEVLDINKLPSEVAEVTGERSDEPEETSIKKPKEIEYHEAPLKFIPGGRRFEPDTDKIKEIEQELSQEEPQKKSGFFSRLFKSELTQERFEELFQELELHLLQSNVAYQVVEKIKQELSSRVVGKSNPSIEKELKEIIKEILIEPPNFVQEIKDSLKNKKPFVIALIGINGAGKTTAIAKLTHLLQKNKLSVCLAAADTYRAASIEQLEVHANRLNVPMIKKDYGTDPASVGFEAIQYAKKNNIDVVMIDTAGRLNNKESLMKELEKIIRVTNPDMKIFTGESTTGNDATEQAKSFDESIGLTGIILSKADIDEKGGTMISVGYITKKPILFIGTGQGYKDLEVFNKEKIIKSLGL